MPSKNLSFIYNLITFPPNERISTPIFRYWQEFKKKYHYNTGSFYKKYCFFFYNSFIFLLYFVCSFISMHFIAKLESCCIAWISGVKILWFEFRSENIPFTHAARLQCSTYERGSKSPCSHLFSLHMGAFIQRWQCLHQVWTHTIIVLTQVDFHRRVEIDSWILMSHIWHDMTLFSV